MNNIQEMYQKAKAAQMVMEDMTQEQIDKIVAGMARTTYKNAEELGNMVTEELRMGGTAAYNIASLQRFSTVYGGYLKGKPSVGKLSEDKEKKITVYGKPMGVVACLAPSTTHIFNFFEIALKAVKAGNGIICSPHPRAWKATRRMAELLQEAVIKAGGPADLIQSIEDPTIELTNELMHTCDVVVGTGGAEMVKAAYSSGKPAFGVGQGNGQVIISRTYNGITAEQLAQTTVNDNEIMGGVTCNSPQTIFIPRERSEEFIKAFEEAGVYMIYDEETIERIRKVIFPDGDRINRAIVGQPIETILKAYEIDAPEGTREIGIKLDDKARGREDVLNKEIMNRTLRFKFYDDFADAVEIARANMFYEGAGHTAILWSDEPDEVALFGHRIPSVRCLINQGSTGTVNVNFANGMPTSSCIGCGTWGGNSISENLDYTTLLNKTHVIYQTNEPYGFTPEEAFGLED